MSAHASPSGAARPAVSPAPPGRGDPRASLLRLSAAARLLGALALLAPLWVVVVWAMT